MAANQTDNILIYRQPFNIRAGNAGDGQKRDRPSSRASLHAGSFE